MIKPLLDFARRHIILFGTAKFAAGLVIGFALGVYFLPILTEEKGLDTAALAQLEASAERSGGFTRVRRQFNVPVAEMEGVQEPLARMASLAYISAATVYQTANLIDHGEKPAVPSAILKSQLTEFQRVLLSDAMDVHGGKAVTLGPRNYLGIGYSANPVTGSDNRLPPELALAVNPA